MGWDRRAVGRAALVSAGVFALVAAGQLGDWWDGPNDAVDAVVQDGLTGTITVEAECEDSQCSYPLPPPGKGFSGYTSSPPRNGTWSEDHVLRHSMLPWAGFPLLLGEQGAAMGVAVVAVVLLLVLGAWRTALVAGVTAAVGGALVDPLKYGGDWAPYPSGHTIGATLMWGLLLTLLVSALRRSEARLPERAERNALLAWGFVALAVGFDLVHSGYHAVSDVVLGWAYSAALVLGAVWLDGAWHAPRTQRTPGEAPA